MAEPVVHHRSPDFTTVYAACSGGCSEVFRTDERRAPLHRVGHRRVRVGGREPRLSRRAHPRRLRRRVRRALGRSWRRVRADVVRSATRGARRRRPTSSRARSPRAAPRSSFLVHSETSTGVVADIEPLVAACNEAGALVGRRRHLEPRRRAARDRRLGHRRRRLRLAEGADDTARPRVRVRLRRGRWRRPGRRRPRFYFDWERTRSAQGKGSTPFTPADVDRRRARRRARAHPRRRARGGLRPARRARPRLPRRRQGDGSRALLAGRRQRRRAHGGPHAGGLEPSSSGSPCATATGSRSPAGRAIVDRLFRIGHIGYVDVFDIPTALGAVERGLVRSASTSSAGPRSTAALDAIRPADAMTRPRPRADRRAGRRAAARAVRRRRRPGVALEEIIGRYDAIVDPLGDEAHRRR